MTKAMRQCSIERLRALLDYDPVTGIFRWRVARTNGIKAGDVAGSLRKGRKPYINISIDDVIYKAHRLAWAWMSGEWPDRQIDHWNTLKFDNRWTNLRLATNSQNCGNAKLSTANTSGHKGVRFCRIKRRWIAAISRAGKRKTLGTFKEKEPALAAYRIAAIAHWGDFARPE